MEEKKYAHKSVMLEECIEALNIRPDGLYADGTVGLGGHSEQIAKRLTTGTLLCFDKDTEALEYSRERLAPFGERVRFFHRDFRSIADALHQEGIPGVDGVLLDLGVSSLQLDKPERGFSYRFDAPLDMRMNTQGGLSAYQLCNEAEESELKRILYQYGEERFAPRIAAAIVQNRPVETTLQLVEIISNAMPAKARREQHPAKRSFQALRIAVNDELGALRECLESLTGLLNPGGRAAILTFHSLEDRMVKAVFNAGATGCTCPPSFPACVCGKLPSLSRQTRQSPSKDEQEANSRSACAKLRWTERLR